MMKDLLQQANSAMRHNRRRTALTMLGMAWGIATVVLLLAYGSGFGRAITTIFSHFGVKIIGVFPAGSHEPVTYPVAATAASKNAQIASYLNFLRSGAAKAIFERYGFSFLTKPVS